MCTVDYKQNMQGTKFLQYKITNNFKIQILYVQ